MSLQSASMKTNPRRRRQVVAAPLARGIGLERDPDSKFQLNTNKECSARQCFLKYIPEGYVEFDHVRLQSSKLEVEARRKLKNLEKHDLAIKPGHYRCSFWIIVASELVYFIHFACAVLPISLFNLSSFIDQSNTPTQYRVNTSRQKIRTGTPPHRPMSAQRCRPRPSENLNPSFQSHDILSHQTLRRPG
jgi:hypothetical protein